MKKLTVEAINEALKEIAAKATLPQAVRISAQYLRHFYPTLEADALYKKIRFKANPSLAFQKSELSSAVMTHNEEGMNVELTLNFLSIFGSPSPLPSHYCETVLRSVDTDSILRDFLDVFNHHLQKFVYPIWLKHRYYVQYQKDLRDTFSKYMLSFLGLYAEYEHRTSRLNLQRLMPYIGMLGMRQKSAGMLLSILRHYLDHEHIEIEQCITNTMAIPSWQRCRLGAGGCTLGTDFLAGESIKSKSGKFRITVKSATWDALSAYSVHGTRMDELRELIGFMLNEPLDYEVALHVEQEKVARCELSCEESAYLGVNSIIGQPRGDLKVIFES